MKLVKTGFEWEGVGVIVTPMENESIFKHCANGSLGVTEEVFNCEVKPILELHGITEFEYEEY